MLMLRIDFRSNAFLDIDRNRVSDDESFESTMVVSGEDLHCTLHICFPC